MEADHAFEILVTFGGLFLLGLLADLAGRHSFLPRVTLLVICGFAIGPSVLDWLPAFTDEWFPALTNVALAMIGFLLGEKLNRKSLMRFGPSVLYISLGVVLATTVLVAGALVLLGVPLIVAALLGGIATATAPAATVDTVQEISARGKFTDTLLGIVAVDDAWGLIVFSLLLATSQSIAGGDGVGGIALAGFWKVFGALLIGMAIGLPMAYLTGRLRPGEPTQTEALGFILLCAGVSIWMNVSHILSAMVLGAMVANLARHHHWPFHEIKGIEWPFLILFFLLSGARLDIHALLEVGMVGVVYIVMRVAGRLVGAYAGGGLAGTDVVTRRWMSVALLPQAGVALGMALLAIQTFPEYEDLILPVVLGATVVFEVAGPIATRWALVRVGEAGRDDR